MIRYLSEAELIETVAALTPDRLVEYRALEIVIPVETPEGPRYREIDVDRVTLLCELADDMEMSEDAVVIIMSLLDQLHGARAQMSRVMEAVAAEEAEIRKRIAMRLIG